MEQSRFQLFSAIIRLRKAIIRLCQVDGNENIEQTLEFTCVVLDASQKIFGDVGTGVRRQETGDRNTVSCFAVSCLLSPDSCLLTPDPCCKWVRRRMSLSWHRFVQSGDAENNRARTIYVPNQFQYCPNVP